MSLRISILSLVLLGYFIILLSNTQSVQFTFFMYEWKIPMFHIMFISSLTGILFYMSVKSIVFKNDRLVKKLIDLEDQVNGSSEAVDNPTAKSPANTEGVTNE
ncbi:MAG: hypothetical protein ABUK01_14225 [Leptospirales bacterium]